MTHDGTTWRRTGGGAQSKPIDPPGQARRCKYALRQHLDNDLRWRRRRVRYAHVVVLATSTVAATSTRPTARQQVALGSR